MFVKNFYVCDYGVFFTAEQLFSLGILTSSVSVWISLIYFLRNFKVENRENNTANYEMLKSLSS